MEYFNNILELIGDTPLIKLNKVNKGLKPMIFAKLESANPGGSVKDRIGYYMILNAEKEGLLKPGGTIIEATSGNTGIGIALTAAIKGYKSIFVLTDKVSKEKINYLKALGSEVVVVSNAVDHNHPEYYVNVARRIQSETPNSFFAYQYSNPANPETHYLTTGPEIWQQTDGKITHFVAGIGTGGTISGVSRYLKEMNPDIKVIGADPYGSILKKYKDAGELTNGTPYLVEGIGADCLSDNVQFQYIDEIINVSDKDSFTKARELTTQEGIFCGGSSGTALSAALKISENLSKDDVVVFIVSDVGERYLSKFYNNEWLKENRLLDNTVKNLRDLSNMKKSKGISKIFYVNDTTLVKDAIYLLDKEGISQLPVFDAKHQSVGSLNENNLMRALLENSALLEMPVTKIMDEPFPIFDTSVEISQVREKLKNNNAVLIKEFGSITDIITRYDIIAIK